MLCACASSGPRANPPAELLADITIPDRGRAATVGDMAILLLEDEKVMRLKNAELKVLRGWFQGGEARP